MHFFKRRICWSSALERYGANARPIAADIAIGSHTRDLITPTGRIDDLNVPRDREGVASSASAVSRLNQTLTEQFDVWRDRPLLSHYRILKQQRGESKLLTWCLLPSSTSGRWQWFHLPDVEEGSRSERDDPMY
jgi:hypothetical protein